MNRWLVAILVSLLVTVLHLGLFLSPWGERMEPLSMDLWYKLHGVGEVPDDMLIAAMDETSYQTLDIPLNQPWPRAMHAKLLDRLAEVGVKRVVFDVLFLGEGTDPKVDIELAEAIGKLPVVLGADSIVQEKSSGSGSFKFEEVMTPYEPFEKNVAQLGLVSFPEDYGFIRRFHTERSAMTKDLSTLSEAAVGIVREMGRPNAVLPGPRDMIHFYGPRATVPTFSYAQFIDPDRPLPAELLKGKTVFVGLVLQTDVGPAQKDVFMTPFGSVFGTEIHATAAQNLQRGEWVRRAPLWLESVLLGLIGFLLCATLFLIRPILGLCVIVGAELLWCAVAFGGAISLHFVPGVILNLVILPLSFLGSTLYYYFVTRKAQLKMESAFQFYVSPQMAKEIAQSKQALGLGGEKIWATALFTDIAGFTSITEDLPAERVSAMLNAYFTEVMDVVFQNDGTLIKFIGDAIFVIWGAPIRINNHAEKACQTALSIQREVKRFNDSARFPPLLTRVGINTGPMVVGNLGSSKRFDYTAIGDSVNLASRVEGINKYFGTSILITGAVKKEVGESFATLNIGAIRVVGKREAVELFLLLPDPLPAAVTDKWNAALRFFRSREWDKSRALFTEISQVEGVLKKASGLYVDQIDHLRFSAVPDEWQGEVTFHEK